MPKIRLRLATKSCATYIRIYVLQPEHLSWTYSIATCRKLEVLTSKFSRADCDAPCFEQLKATHLRASPKQQALLDVLLQLIKTWPLTIGPWHYSFFHWLLIWDLIEAYIFYEDQRAKANNYDLWTYPSYGLFSDLQKKRSRKGFAEGIEGESRLQGCFWP